MAASSRPPTVATPPQNFPLWASRYSALWRSESPRMVVGLRSACPLALPLIQRPRLSVTRPTPRKPSRRCRCTRGRPSGACAGSTRAGGRHQRAGLLGLEHAGDVLAGGQVAAEGVGPLGLQAHQPLAVQVARAQVQARVQPVGAAQLAHRGQHHHVGVEALGQPAGVALLELPALLRRREAQPAQALGREAALELGVQHLLAGGLVGRDDDALGERGHARRRRPRPAVPALRRAAGLGPVGLVLQHRQLDRRLAHRARRRRNTSQPSGRRQQLQLGAHARRGRLEQLGWPPGRQLVGLGRPAPGNSSMVSSATFLACVGLLGGQRRVTSSRLVRHSSVVALGRAGPLLGGGPQLGAHPLERRRRRRRCRRPLLRGTASTSAARRLTLGVGQRRRLILGQRGDGLALLDRPLRVLA